MDFVLWFCCCCCCCCLFACLCCCLFVYLCVCFNHQAFQRQSFETSPVELIVHYIYLYTTYKLWKSKNKKKVFNQLPFCKRCPLIIIFRLSVEYACMLFFACVCECKWANKCLCNSSGFEKFFFLKKSGAFNTQKTAQAVADATSTTEQSIIKAYIMALVFQFWLMQTYIYIYINFFSRALFTVDFFLLCKKKHSWYF